MKGNPEILSVFPRTNLKNILKEFLESLQQKDKLKHQIKRGDTKQLLTLFFYFFQLVFKFFTFGTSTTKILMINVCRFKR